MYIVEEIKITGTDKEFTINELFNLLLNKLIKFSLFLDIMICLKLKEFISDPEIDFISMKSHIIELIYDQINLLGIRNIYIENPIENARIRYDSNYNYYYYNSINRKSMQCVRFSYYDDQKDIYDIALELKIDKIFKNSLRDLLFENLIPNNIVKALYIIYGFNHIIRSIKKGQQNHGRNNRGRNIIEFRSNNRYFNI